MTNLNNNTLYIIASDLDSVTPTSHIVCNLNLSGNVIRDTRPQTIISPESRPLESPIVFEEFGGFSFWIHKIKFLVAVLAV